MKLLALLCVGDIGSTRDLSSQVDLKTLIDGAAAWPSEDVRAAGAQAIGTYRVLSPNPNAALTAAFTWTLPAG